MAADESCYVVSSSSLDSATESSRIQLMPCEIGHNGEANISSYFDTTVRKEKGTDQNEVLDASFRGRKLKGAVVPLPAGYAGYVLREDRKPTTDEEDHTLRATHKVSQFTYWNLETPPSGDDSVVKAMQWVNIASVLHGKSEEDQLATPDTIR